MKRIAVITSGGDAPGMNAAVRAVVRAALAQGVEVFGISDGYRGLIAGGDHLRPMAWNSVGGILHLGGTTLGSAPAPAMHERDGRQRAARHLAAAGIEGLVVIGGDGSLSGAAALQTEWPAHLDALQADDDSLPSAVADRRHLALVGIPASITNDVAGSDVCLGADTALHRIVAAVDAIGSTAASHQRAFVVEVMGEQSGYLALMGALASGADWLLIPEDPPEADWETAMTDVLGRGRHLGRRDSIVMLAEGARDLTGQPITSEHVKQVIEERLGEDTRITVLGHVQRGGAPSAYDRNLGTLLGAAAVHWLLKSDVGAAPVAVGTRANRVVHTPLADCLERTRGANLALDQNDYQRALRQRSASFREALAAVRTLVRAQPRVDAAQSPGLRLAVMNAGGPAPGMNTAVRVAVRLGLDQGHTMLGIANGFRGLIDGDIRPLDWMSVSGWATRGGSDLGTNRYVPGRGDLYAIARHLEEHQVQGLLVIGGWSGYRGALQLFDERQNYPAFNLPIVCLPATINNNLPGAELCIGADTALNSIVEAVDKIKSSAVASRRAFVVEVMGRNCGYLALMSALATGAERVYLHEEGVTLEDLAADVHNLVEGFRGGKRLGLLIRNERANPIYTTRFMASLFEEEGGKLFDVRQAILGHMQQGGDPSPFDRILATRMATRGIALLEAQIGAEEPMSACLGLMEGGLRETDFLDVPRLMDLANERPRGQWWLAIRPVARTLGQPAPEPPGNQAAALP